MRTKIPSVAVIAALAALVAVVAGCSGNKKNQSVVGPPVVTGVIAGTITLPGTTANELLWIAVDNDSTDTNGYVKYDTMTTTDAITFDYVIDSVPIDDYYVYGGVLIGHTDMPPRTDDLFGYYDTGLTPPPDQNVTVVANDTVIVSFSVSKLP